MKLLLDTHILLWTIAESRRLSASARALIGDAGSENHVQHRQPLGGRNQDRPRSRRFSDRRRVASPTLLDNRFAELTVTGAHAVALAALPQLHKDPFDRMLVAQAMVEGVTLVTGDRAVARYPGPIRLI